MYNILFTYSSVDKPLGGLHFLASLNNAAMNIHVQVFVSTYVLISFGYKSSNGHYSPK